MKEKIKQAKLNILKKKSIKEIKNLKEQQKEFNVFVNKHVKELSKENIDLEDVKEIKELHRKGTDTKGWVKYTKRGINEFLKNKKYRFIVTIFLKSNKIRCFEVYETRSIKGFYFDNGYYNIEWKSSYIQNNEAYIYYVEGISAPINFREAKYENNDITLELNSYNLKDIVDRQVFKGLMTLGKSDGGIDWKFALMGMGVIAIVVLQYTGQIDLMSMLKLS